MVICWHCQVTLSSDIVVTKLGGDSVVTSSGDIESWSFSEMTKRGPRDDHEVKSPFGHVITGFGVETNTHTQ